MAKLRILAVEDEPLHQATILMCTEKLGYELIGIEDNYTDALGKLIATQPDIILLDIQISGDKDGIELAARINELRPTPIIFTTSMMDSETIKRASQTQPYGYLIKPIKAENLAAAIEVAIARFSQDQANLEKVQQHTGDIWQQDPVLNGSLFIKDQDKMIKVALEDVLWVEVDKNKYCKVVTSKKVFFVRNSLHGIASKLPPNNFMQIHRSLLVQIGAIDGIYDKDLVLEIQGTQLPIGKSYKKGLLDRLSTL